MWTGTTPAPTPTPQAGQILGLDVFPASPVNVAPGTRAAELGIPTLAKFNGLSTITDTLHHRPKHAIAASWGTLLTPLASVMTPSISDVAVLNRRDALIVYVPAVKGAADYRAYIYDPSKVTFSGTQPRGAVVACAGYRQRYERNVDSFLTRVGAWVETKNRELIQAIEVPGLVTDGNYQVIVEALASPCPFTGMMGHTSSAIPLYQSTNSVPIRSFNDVRQLYGNEIINGQGSTLTDYRTVNAAHTAPAETVGQAVPPTDAKIPADPVVIARSAIRVVRPAADEAANAPVIDVGSNAVLDDFSTDAVMTSLVRSPRLEGGGLTSEGQFGNWFFWSVGIQQALDAQGHPEVGDNPKGLQVWQRHGRLYTTFGDWSQDVVGAVYFSSTKTLPQQLDSTKYVHSVFRVNSGATGRRYWHWMMCGGATRDELVDPATRIPRGRPVAQANFYLPASAATPPLGLNPSAPMAGEARTQYHNKECLNLIQLGTGDYWGAPANAVASTWFDEPHSELRSFISPAGVDNGIINLKADGYGGWDGDGGMAWRVNANKQPTMPMFEPFDQEAPLTHFNVFVRPDRVIFYINGRQAWCADLSDRPLTMKYGHIAYGNLLYHSGAEIMPAYLGPSQNLLALGGSTHYVMNTPSGDTRAWDMVGHTEKIDIPSQFAFDPATCFKPKTTAVQ